MGTALINLASGREIQLDRLIIEDTYLEVEGGTPEERRAMLLDIPYERVVSVSGDDTPFVMIDPPPGDLPALTFIGQFSSDKPVRNGKADAFSELTICWYAADYPKDLTAHVAATVADVDWDTLAGNFEY